jgi:hypothetical protein
LHAAPTSLRSVNVTSGKFDSPWLVYSERVETARVYVRDNTMVGAYALLLFGGELVVDHARGRLSMDGWAEFDAPARVGVLIREVRSISHRSPYDRVGVVHADPRGLLPAGASLRQAGPSLSIPTRLDAFQTQLTPLNATPTFARMERDARGGGRAVRETYRPTA